MKVTIEFHWSGEVEELDHILDQLEEKLPEQAARAPGCVCTAPERADLVYCLMGTRLGTIKVEKDEE